MKHPNIMILHDFFSEEGHYFLVTELIEGGELFDRIVEKVSSSNLNGSHELASSRTIPSEKHETWLSCCSKLSNTAMIAM